MRRRVQQGQAGATARKHTAGSAPLICRAALLCSVLIAGALIELVPEAHPAGAASSTPPSLFTPQLLTNPSFEQGVAGWSANSGQNVAVYQGGATEDSHYLETNTGSAGPGGGVLQNVSTTLAAGHGYEAWVSLRSPAWIPISVGVALIATGPGVSTETQTTGSVVSSPRWTRVPVQLDVTGTGYTNIELLIYLLTTGANLDIDRAGLQDSGLANASFEQGFNGWVQSGVNVAVYPGGAAEDGHYLETNKAASGATVYQDVATTPVAGHSYRAQVFMRSPSGKPIGVVLALSSRNGATTQTASGLVTVGSRGWRVYSVEIDVNKGGRNDLRFSISPRTSGVNLDVDGASLFDAGVANASFEKGSLDWSWASGQNVAIYNGGLENTRYLETNTGSAPSASVYQDIPATVIQGDSYRDTVALRSPSNRPAMVDVVLWALGGSSPAEAGSTLVRITNAKWTHVPAELDVASAGHSDLRVQFYVQTPGVNVDLDAAQLTQAPGVAGLDALRSAIVSTAISQDQYHAAVREQPPDTDCNIYSTYWRAGSQAPCGGDGLYAEGWCADFASWVWSQAGVNFTRGYASGDIDGWSYSFVQWGVDHGTFKPGATNDPVPGDVAVWGNTSTGYGQHAGIVVGVSGGQIDIVSGNSGPGDALGNNISVWRWGYFNPATSNVNGYPLVGYVAPEANATNTALPANTATAAPFLAAPSTSASNSYANIAKPGPLTRQQLAQRIAEQDGGR